MGSSYQKPFMHIMHRHRITIAYLLINIIFFFLLGDTKVAYTNDSLGYLQVNFAREPVYPLLIQLFLRIFGENSYLTAITYFQGLLAVGCIYYTLYSLHRHFKLHPYELLGLNLLLWIPYGIDTLWDSPRIVYTHYIMTEGITNSLFYLFFTLLIAAILDKSYFQFILSALTAVILCLSRGQMLICFPALIVGLCIMAFPNIKKLAAYAVFLACAFLSVSFLTKTYHYYYNGIFASPMENSLTIFSNLLYASDAQDSALITSPEEAAFYQEVFRQAYDNGYNYAFADQGIIKTGNHLMASHDKIKYDILRPALYAYTDNLGMSRDYAAEQAKKELLESLNATLRKANLGQWIYDCFCLLPMCLLLSFNPVTPPALLPLCYLYAYFMTAASIVFVLYRLIKEKKLEKGTLLLGACLTLLLVNAGGLSISIYGISRYTNYTMGLYYISLYICVKEFIKLRFTVLL